MREQSPKKARDTGSTMDHFPYAKGGDSDHCTARLNFVRQFLEFGGLRDSKSENNQGGGPQMAGH